MKPIFALLPSDDITQQIYRVRNEIINKDWGVEGERTQVLPHLSVSYLKEINNLQLIEKIKTELTNQFHHLNRLTLNIVRVRTWSNKVSIMFDNHPVRELVSKLEGILNKYDVSENQIYLSQLNKSEKERGEKTFNTFEEVAGDHIKIVRNIRDEHLSETIDYISQTLPGLITFDKFVFIDYGCTDKDILWKVDLKEIK